MPFPTAFPSAAASAVGQAILNRSVDRSLLEPAYDLQGYAEYRILSALPAPQPSPPTPAKVFGQGISDDEPELSREQVGNILMAAADDFKHCSEAAIASNYAAASPSFGADKALPWKSILSVLFTIIQGLLLSEQPPIDNPAK